MKPSPRGEEAYAFFRDVQDEITSALESADGSGRTFRSDSWEREGGGGGRSRVLVDGDVFEKGGVNVSCVHGELSEAFAKEIPGEGRSFFATGISLVIHPRSPRVPTVHANFRYLEKGEGDTRSAWFGGGADLTPYVLYREDARSFHQVWHDVCARHPVANYERFKKACDEYFYLPHRGEGRGIGGIFFDYLGLERGGEPSVGSPESIFAFVKDAARSFLPAYLPIVERRRGAAHNPEEREWQLMRRGRYVEFNLIYDRGTIFGLKTGGRVESILMSLPALVRWGYDERPTPGTYQEELVNVLEKPRDWLSDRDDG